MKIIVKALNQIVDGNVHGAEGSIQFLNVKGDLLHTENFSGKINFDIENPYSRTVNADVSTYRCATSTQKLGVNFDWELV